MARICVCAIRGKALQLTHFLVSIPKMSETEIDFSQYPYYLIFIACFLAIT